MAMKKEAGERRQENGTASVLHLLKQPIINIERLRFVSSKGLPDRAGIRGTVWRILLDYLPAHTDLWESSLASKRSEYQRLVSKYINPNSPLSLKTFPASEASSNASSTFLPLSQISSSNHSPESLHPLMEYQSQSLSRRHDGIWVARSEDRQLEDEIEKDLIRTFQEFALFSNRESGAHASLSRILFIYAKTNSHGLSYVQGLNEVVACLYFVFATDENEEMRMHAEADTFFCFTELVVAEFFRKEMESTSLGGSLTGLEDLLKFHDPLLYQRFVSQNLDLTYFGLRWFSCFLSREFDLLDCIRIWDSLLANPNRVQWLQFFCCGMIINKRHLLLSGDFAENLQMLQNYPPSSVDVLLEEANEIKRSTDMNIPRHKLVEEDVISEKIEQFSVFLTSAFDSAKSSLSAAAFEANTRLQTVRSQFEATSQSFSRRLSDVGVSSAVSNDAKV